MFERIGGAEALRRLIDDFVDRLFADVMIGFMFQRANRERIKRFEFQHAAVFLGATVEYEGRPLRQAHQPHKIMGGQFDRRREILRQVLRSHSIAPDIQAAWLEHTESLRSEITSDGAGQCNAPTA